MKDKYYIAFSRIEEIGSVFVQKLFNHFGGDIEQAYSASAAELYEIDGITPNKVQTFVEKRKDIDVEQSFDFIKEQGLKYITFEDKNYPRLLPISIVELVNHMIMMLL